MYLNYSLQPDPLIDALEAVVGDYDPLDGRLEAAQPDTEVIFKYSHLILL